MRAVETRENEDGVIFLLGLKDGRFHVVILTLRQSAEQGFSNGSKNLLDALFCMIKQGRLGDIGTLRQMVIVGSVVCAVCEWE